jgi:hypothetical protein
VEVVVVDRDPGPPGPTTAWQRKGVMQFHHAHTFRGQVVDAVRAEMPDVLDDLVTAGATIATTAESRPVALLCRRTTFERTLWNRAAAQQDITPCAVTLTGSSTSAAGPSGSRSTAAR